MFEIEVVRFDAQDVIATSSTCPAANGSLHIYIQNGEATIYTYDGENFTKLNADLGVKFNTAVSESSDGWYAFTYKNGISQILYNYDGTLAGKCDDSLYHPIQ